MPTGRVNARSVQLVVRVPHADHEMLHLLAAHRGVTVGEVVRGAIGAELDRVTEAIRMGTMPPAAPPGCSA